MAAKSRLSGSLNTLVPTEKLVMWRRKGFQLCDVFEDGRDSRHEAWMYWSLLYRSVTRFSP